MAFITAETRSSIVELAMGMLNQAPSTAMLNTLIAKSVEGASIQDLADYIATTDAFTAEYPATQTAREFATEMFGKLITGGTLDADINTAVIDLLEGLLIAGTTKAQGFVAVIEFLANPANASHPDLGDISQSFQNRADAAEYFSITKELGGSTDAELAAAIASVTSDADTLTAANEAADATADAEEVVAGQTFTLTTGIDEIVGTNGDEIINASATSVSGTDITTLSSGDSVDGGAGTDTLNLTATADDNNSLAGVTVKNVEVINITGANNIDSVSTADASADAGTKQVTSINISSPAPVAEVQVLDFGDIVVDAGGRITIAEASGAGSDFDGAFGNTAGSFDVTVEDGDTAEEVATAVAAAMNKFNANGTAATDDGLVTAEAVGAKVVITYDAYNGETGASAGLYDPTESFIEVTASGTGAATFESGTVTTATSVVNQTTTAASAAVDVSVTIDGTEYTSENAVTIDVTTSSTSDASNYFGSADDAAAAKLSAAEAARTEAIALINKVIGGSVTAANGNEATEMLLSAAAVGVELPEVSVSSEDDSISSIDTKDSQTIDFEERTSLTTAVAQQQRIVIDKIAADDELEVFIGGASFGKLISADDSEATMATAVADAINIVLGEGTAIAVGTSVTVTAPAAGTPLPNITIDAVNAPAFTSELADVTAAGITVDAELAAFLNDKGIAADASGNAFDEGGTVSTIADDTAADAILDSLAAVDSAVESQTRVNVDIAVDVESATDGAVSAASFAGSEQIWLKGAASNSTDVTGVGTQTIGLSGVTKMDNSIAYGATVTSATLAIAGSGGDLSVKGAKLDTLTLSGTTTAGATGLVITDGSTTGTIETVNVSMSGATILDITAADAVETLTSTGEGGLTLTSTGLETITTGEGADKVTANTVTAKDNANTTTDETVSSTVTTGAGADTVVLETTGTGNTTVDTGAGADYVKWDSAGSGDVVVDTGADDDTVLLVQGTAELTAKSTLDGGAGTDTLISTGGGTITSSVYTMLETVVSGFEVLQFSTLAGNTKAVDASKLSQFSAFTFTTTGSNTIEEVDGQTLTLTGVVEVDAEAEAYTGTVSGSRGDALKATAAGYDANGNAANGNQPIYGGDLNVVVTGPVGLNGNALDLYGNAATISVSPKVAASAAKGFSAPTVTLTGDVVTANVSLLSYDYEGTTFRTTFKVEVDADGESSGTNQTLKALEAITVTGAGKVDLDLRTSIAADDVVLSTIDLSGMYAVANVDKEGDLEFDGGNTTYDNESETVITLDDDVAETVILGGAEDTIKTKSKLDVSDVIEGLELNATAEDADVVDADTSDSIVITLANSSNPVVADDSEYANLNIALLAVADLKDGSSDVDEVVFHAEGNTYIYRDTGANGLTDDDVLVTVVGTYDLDLIAQIIT